MRLELAASTSKYRENELKEEKSKIAQQEQEVRNKWLFFPGSCFLSMFDTVAIVCLFAACIGTPAKLAFGFGE